MSEIAISDMPLGTRATPVWIRPTRPPELIVWRRLSNCHRRQAASAYVAQAILAQAAHAVSDGLAMQCILIRSRQHEFSDCACDDETLMEKNRLRCDAAQKPRGEYIADDPSEIAGRHAHSFGQSANFVMTPTRIARLRDNQIGVRARLRSLQAAGRQHAA